MSPVVFPGEQKCLATGRSAFFVTERRCSQYLSPSLRPISSMYDRVHARQVIIVNEVTSGTRESLSDRQKSTRSVDLGQRVCVAAGLTP